MKGYLVGLGLSMALSICCLLALYLYYPGFGMLVPFVLIMGSGLIGLYFSTKVKVKKIRGFLLVINYLFATPFNVYLFFAWLIHFF